MYLRISPLVSLSLLLYPVSSFQTPSHVLARRQWSSLAAGFGSAPRKAPAKLKPKAQWDRYLSLTSETPVPVGVFVDDEWWTVGSVKAKDASLTGAAVVRQRGLLVEVGAPIQHTRSRTPLVSRLTPLGILYRDHRFPHSMPNDFIQLSSKLKRRLNGDIKQMVTMLIVGRK